MPSFAVLATAALVLGPGRERPAIGARLWGIPRDGGTVAAFRIETLERQYGSDRAVAVDGLELSVRLAGSEIGRWTGRSGDDGVAEALVRAERPLSGPIELRIRSGRTLLGEGPLPQRPLPPLTLEKRRVEGTAEGPVKLQLDIVRGVLAAPFPGSVRVLAMRDGSPAEGIFLKPSANGAETPAIGREIVTSSTGEATFSVTPTWHAVDLKVEATDRSVNPPTISKWEGGLPVQPGALWLGLSRPQAEILSPVPRERVYVTAIGAMGRVFGQVVALSKNDSGFYQGTLDMTELTRHGAEAVTLAGDPTEVGSGTVTWPVDSSWAVVAAPRVERLYDGLPFAELREQKRAGTARLASVTVALLAGVFEVILLVLYSRESQRKLAAHLAQLSEDAEERAAASRMTAAPISRAITLVVTIGLVVLGFGAVAAFAIVR